MASLPAGINEGQREILFIIAELSGRSVTNSIRDTAVVEVSGLPAEEVYDYLNQLEGLGYILQLVLKPEVRIIGQ
jgi:hypothetical protein